MTFGLTVLSVNRRCHTNIRFSQFSSAVALDKRDEYTCRPKKNLRTVVIWRRTAKGEACKLPLARARDIGVINLGEPSTLTLCLRLAAITGPLWFARQPAQHNFFDQSLAEITRPVPTLAYLSKCLTTRLKAECSKGSRCEEEKR
jgi:hypothetical protein